MEEIIYILELAGRNFYIGKTNNLARRFQEHKEGRSSASWVRLHGGIKLIEVFPIRSSFDEDIRTLEYMKMYSLDRVRGGSFCEITLSEEQISNINQLIRTSDNLCNICGEAGHYAQQCNQNTIHKLRESAMNNKRVICYKCNMSGHYANNCNSKNNTLDIYNLNLFEQLRILRKKFADDEKCACYLIFNDKTLIQMATKLPKNIDEFMLISGINEQKTEKYGKQFLDIIANY